MNNDLQILKGLEELLEGYLSEGSVDKALTLYYITEHGYDLARKKSLMEFSSLKPYLQVVEDLGRVGVNTIPQEAKNILRAKEDELIQLLMRDARDAIEKYDILTKRLVALALLLFENSHELPSSPDMLYYIYEALTGERIPKQVREEHNRHLLRLHILTSGFGTLYWSVYAPYILRALKDKVPRIIVEFKTE
jgi:hypothetical protein